MKTPFSSSLTALLVIQRLNLWYFYWMTHTFLLLLNTASRDAFFFVCAEHFSLHLRNCAVD